MLRTLFALLLTSSALILNGSRAAVAETPVPLKVPEGFTATLYADDELATDISSLTINSLGQVVVAGPGYVTTLIDADKDGQAETVKQFAPGPASGAQGMCFHGPDLLCLGDEGLLRYRDENEDGVADGEPDLFLKIRSGPEHGSHAIRQGPDGWWYIIAGNQTGVTEKFASLPRSPVKYPRAGVLIRLKPDLSGGQIYAQGFRNAYDFAFNADGDLFTFDSDGERDISLPWYRPTRVFHLVRGADAGWVSRSWKRPNDFLDMPPVIAEFGRGSPSGVTCYRHTQFPEKYQGALFVEDWTFGRVFALPLLQVGSTYHSKPELFISGQGDHGFAPTDLEVGADGSLFVSVGGRGTRGGVYRIEFTGKADTTAEADESPEEGTTELLLCLDAPQPLSSWSRKKWVPVATALGADPFQQAAINTDLTDTQRVRAIQILTEQFAGIHPGKLTLLIADRSPRVRAAAAWSLGRNISAGLEPEILRTLLIDPDPHVRRKTIEAVADGAGSENFRKVLPALALVLADSDRFVRHAGMRSLSDLDNPTFQALGKAIPQLGWGAIITNTAGFLLRRNPDQVKFSPYAVNASVLMLKGDHPPTLKLRAARLMQLGLGDLGNRPGVADAFAGYSSPLDLQPHERELDEARILLAELYPTGAKPLDWELGRLIAVLTSYNPELLTKVLAPINAESHPTDDIHQLLIAGRILSDRNEQQRTAIAQALVGIEHKLTTRNLNRDNNWDDRIREMYLQLVELDEKLPAAVIEQPSFGHPGHTVFFNGLSAEELPRAVQRLVEVTKKDEEYPWDNDVVFAIANVTDDATLNYLRPLYENLALRDAVTIALAKRPREADRGKFLEGLSSPQMEVKRTSLAALDQLSPSDSADQVIALVGALGSLQGAELDYRLREMVVELLRRDTKQNFGFVLGKNGHQPQRKVVSAWRKWAAAKYPDYAEELKADHEEDAAKLKQQLAAVDWAAGDIARGAALYKSRACSQCHGGGKGLGPDLTGVAGRFSRDDLFIAIAQPNRDVSSRYQTTLVETKGGKVYTGRVVYTSVDGVTLRTGLNQTIRIEAAQIESQKTVDTSLMPTGLLNDLQPSGLADLYRYLQSLSPQEVGKAAQSDQPTSKQ